MLKNKFSSLCIILIISCNANATNKDTDLLNAQKHYQNSLSRYNDAKSEFQEAISNVAQAKKTLNDLEIKIKNAKLDLEQKILIQTQAQNNMNKYKQELDKAQNIVNDSWQKAH